MRKKFGYQAMAAIFAVAMIVSGAGMYQTTAKAAEEQIRTPQQKTAAETQESAKRKAEAASADPTEDGEYTLTFEAKQELHIFYADRYGIDAYIHKLDEVFTKITK